RGGFLFWQTADRMVFSVARPSGQDGQGGGRDVFAATLVGANPDAEFVGRDLLTSRSNYFQGDPSQWHSDVSNYATVLGRGLFPNIDLVLHARSDRSFEYDFRLRAGADVAAIRMRWEGLQSVSLDEQGRLLLQTGGGTVIQEAPIIYQEGQAGV